MRPTQHTAERISGLLVEQLNNLPCFSSGVDGRSLKSEAKPFSIEMLGTVASKDRQNRQTGHKKNDYLSVNTLDSISFTANIVNTLGYFYSYTKL